MSNIELEVKPHPPVTVSDETYPWINASPAEITVAEVELAEDVSFLYGSIIGLNRSISKIAGSIPDTTSRSLQNALFAAIPALLSGNRHQGISKVDGSLLKGKSTLFIANRNIVTEPSLVFALDNTDDSQELPLILRAGVSTARDRPKLLGAMGIKQVSGRRRKC